jgi:hypothetical protein
MPTLPRKTTRSDTHRRAEEMLRRLGYEPLRQFVPAKDYANGDELFEMWHAPASPGTIIRIVVVHFYQDGHGCDFYLNGAANTWESAEAFLAAAVNAPTEPAVPRS